MKKVKCTSHACRANNLRVRIIKAPLVDTRELKAIVLARARAIVL